MCPEAHEDGHRIGTGHGMGPGGGQDMRAPPHPLNSHRLMQPLLRQLVAELEVPRQVASGDIRLLIEAVITEGGHKPQNVQVLVQDSEMGRLCACKTRTVCSSW